MTRLIFVSFMCLLCKTALYAQTITVGSQSDNELRSLQLMGEVDSTFSFTVRPLSRNKFLTNHYLPFSQSKDTISYGKDIPLSKKYAHLSILNINVNQQYNSHHPYGWNDGSMISAKGYQVQVSAGVYASVGPLELQLQPEWVYAANTPYSVNAEYGSNNGKAYQKFFPGQSSIKLSAFSLSAGVSTENLWWGPGMRSSLLMSNNAPGFLHGFIRTTKPLKSFIGNFEWQLIGAKLMADADRPFENNHLKSGSISGKSRYLNAFVFSYNPKWTPGIFLGVARALQTSVSDAGLKGSSFFDKYLPILFKPVQKINIMGDDTLGTDQLASFFLRWVFFKAKAEFYVEYGFNDYGINTRDYLLGPSHSAAYLVGIRKVISCPQNKRIELGAELTQMSQSPDWIVRNSGNWYVHSQVLEGYTHQNQILGAGAGFGANVFSMDATWVNGWKRLGFLFERVDRDPQERTNKWIDLGIGVLPQWKYKQFIISGLFEIVHTNNYLWEAGNTAFNLHTRLSVNYHF